MIASFGPPPASLEKEMERIEGKRARNVARTNRFLDARLRTIGLDTDALDAQMQERQAQAEREKLAISEEWDRNDFVYKQVELQEAEERRLRDQELERMRLTWLAQMKFKDEKERKEKDDIHRGVDFQTCGASAVQKMAGEDPGRAARLEQQRTQMRDWTRQQSEARRAKEAEEGEDMAAYWAYLERANALQGELSKEEEAARKKINLLIKDENKLKVLQKGEEMAKCRQQEREADAAELRYRDKFLRESDGDGHGDGDGDGVPARAGFKGMSKQQKEAVIESNADVVKLRAQQAKEAREEEAKWFFQQESLREAMEQADQEERRRMKESEAEMLRDLQAQQLERRQRNMKERQDRFGGIDFTHGMYAGFGKSCR